MGGFVLHLSTHTHTLFLHLHQPPPLQPTSFAFARALHVPPRHVFVARAASISTLLWSTCQLAVFPSSLVMVLHNWFPLLGNENSQILFKVLFIVWFFFDGSDPTSFHACFVGMVPLFAFHSCCFGGYSVYETLPMLTAFCGSPILLIGRVIYLTYSQ